MKKREENIKRLIKKVLNFKKPAAWVMIILGSAVLSSVCLLTNPVLKLKFPDATSMPSMEMEQINEGARVGENIEKGHTP